jgi:predicted NBD/HSP70 family sugar kinase
MLSKTKKDRKNAQLKQFILKSRSISRAEAVEHADLDIRTASSYLEKLCQQGFCRKDNCAPEGKGRPGIVYRANLENMLFVGVSINQNMSVNCVLCTIDGEILQHKKCKFNDQQSKLTVFNTILDMVKDVSSSCTDKKIAGIGIAMSRWLQPPLAAFDLYSGLIKFLKKETQADVYRTMMINALAYDAANTCNQKDLIIFHAGDVIELGIVQNGRHIQNYQEHEKALAHLMVNESGPTCYCGKKGCLENYVTNIALREKLLNISPGGTLNDFKSNSKIKKLKDEIIEYLVEACSYLDQTYKPQQIQLMLNDWLADLVIAECKKEKIKSEVSYFKKDNNSLVRGAALMAAFMVVNQYK